MYCLETRHTLIGVKQQVQSLLMQQPSSTQRGHINCGDNLTANPLAMPDFNKAIPAQHPATMFVDRKNMHWSQQQELRK